MMRGCASTGFQTGYRDVIYNRCRSRLSPVLWWEDCWRTAPPKQDLIYLLELGMALHGSTGIGRQP